MALKILVDGRLAITIRQGCDRYGIEYDALRKAVERFRADGLIEPCEDKVDGRTQVYLATPLDKLMRARPGKGANLRGKKREEASG